MNRYRHANGNYVWLEWNAHTAAQERAVYAVARDVTDRVRQAELDQAAEHTRRQLAALVESSDDA
jgi:PAS domain-containing protein